MNVSLLLYPYLAILLATCLVGVFRYKAFDFGTRVFALLLCLTFINECLAYYAARRFGNNSPVYNIYSIIGLFLLGVFFNQVIDVFRKRSLGVVLGALGAMLGVMNLLVFQPIDTLNTYFFLLEGVVIISLALFFFARMMLDTNAPRISLNPHFWLTVILTFFWSTTFFNWGFYGYMNAVHPDKVWFVNALLLVINILTYAAYGIVLLLYPSLKRKQ